MKNSINQEDNLITPANAIEMTSPFLTPVIPFKSSKNIEMTELMDEPNVDQEKGEVRNFTLSYKQRKFINVKNEKYLDTSKMSRNIKRIFRTLVIKTIEEPKIESDLTVSVADTNRFIFPDGQDMENIYLNIRNTKKFNNIISIAGFLNLLSMTFLMIILLMLAIPRNNAYFFNVHNNSFESKDITKLCNEKDFTDCSSIYVLDKFNGSRLYEENELTELKKINKIFGDAFLYQNLLIENFNKMTTKQFSNIAFSQNKIIYVKHNDNTNLFVASHKLCDLSSVQIEIGFFCLVGFLVGNLVLSFFADIFGRKKLIFISIVIQLSGLLLISTLFYFALNTNYKNFMTESEMESYGIKSKDELDFDFVGKRFNFTPPNYFVFKNEEKLRHKYNEVFKELNLRTLENKAIKNQFTKWKIYIYFIIMLNCISMSGVFTISLSLTFEFCVHEQDIYLYYFRFFCNIVLSLPLAYLLLYFTDSLPLTFFILFLLYCILSVFAFLTIKESPRYHFEYSEYDKMTYCLLELCDHKDLKKLFKEYHNDEIQDEVAEMENINKENILNYTFFQPFVTVNQLRQNRKLKANRHNAIRGTLSLPSDNLIVISKYNNLFNVGGFFRLIISDKLFIKQISLHYALIAVSCLLYYITLTNFNLMYNFRRESQMLGKLTYSIVSLLSIYVFNILVKFFGFKFVLVSGFIGSFLINFICNILKFVYINTYYDLNLEYHNSFKNVTTRLGNWASFVLCFQSFFTTGIYFTLFLSLLQYSKTLYRCLFYGIINLIADGIFLVFLSFSSDSSTNMTYGIIVSLIGILISGYLNYEEKNNFVNEYHLVPRKLKKYW